MAFGAAAALAIGAPISLTAQSAAGQLPPPQEASADGDGKRVFLMTVGQGDKVEELFGHNAIWIHDPTTGLDLTYHWGVFNYQDPGFLARFLRGEMIYSTRADPLDASMAAYRRAGREIRIQELRFTPAQTAVLEERIRINHLPENRDYRYDYYLDNCSTRVRDMLDAALGGVIRSATDEGESGETYRSLTLQQTWRAPLVYTGLQLGMGNPTEQAVTPWEEMFLPARLAHHIESVTVPTAEGPAPLVVYDDIPLPSDRPAVPSDVPGRLLQFLAIGLLLGGVSMWLGRKAGGGSRWARRGLVALGGSWSLVASLASLVLLWMTLFTAHSFAYRNENLFQFVPLSVLLMAMLILPGSRWVERLGTARVAWIIAGASIAGFVLQILPGLDQMNGELIALALPIHLGLAVALTGVRPTTS